MTTEKEDQQAADSQQVFCEQVRLVYRLGISGAMAVCVVAVLYALVVWPVAPRSELIGWCIAISVVSLARIVLARISERGDVEGHTRAWAWGLLVLATLTGLCWAYAGTRLFPYDHPQTQLVSVIMLVGMPAGAVASFGPYAKSYACYLVSAIVPFAIGQYLHAGAAAGWLVFATLVFMLYLMRVSLWIEKTLRDNITQRLELQRLMQDLAHARDLALAADRAKSNLLVSINEEVRNPLNAMRNVNDQLLVSPLNAEQRNQLQTVQQASVSLLHMLDTALDLNRMNAGPLDVREERFNPHTILTRIGHMYRPLALRKHLAFDVAIEPDTPKALLGDPVRWLQVVGILVDNALKFTDEGVVSVQVAASVNGGVCVLRAEVTDTGVGLAPEERYALFKRLTQAYSLATPEDDDDCASLGIAAELAKLMGGDIGVTSEKGAGSRFWFNARLRLAPEEVK